MCTLAVRLCSVQPSIDLPQRCSVEKGFIYRAFGFKHLDVWLLQLAGGRWTFNVFFLPHADLLYSATVFTLCYASTHERAKVINENKI